MENQLDNQSLIKELFFKYVSLIPHDLCDVIQYMDEDRYNDYGADELVLELQPKNEDRCNLSLYAGHHLCYGKLGKHAHMQLLTFDRHVDLAYIENIIHAAIYGPVTETEWTWRGRLLRHTTQAYYGSEQVEEGSVTQPLWYVRFFLPGVIKHSFTYEPYTSRR